MQIKAFGIRAKATWQSTFTCVLAFAATFTANLPSLVKANSFALGAATTINLQGSAIQIDSYDSRATNYSTDGLYDPSKARDQGDIVTTAYSGTALNLGNARVMGRLMTGSNGLVSLGSSGSVGSKEWVQSGRSGIQAGWWTKYINSAWPNVTLPKGKIYLIPIAGAYNIIDPATGQTKTYKYVLTANYPWKLPVIDGSIYVNGKNVVLWVSGDANGNGVALSATDEIRIPIGADGVPNNLDVYMGAASADFGGNGVVNDTGQAKSFRYFGLSSNTSLRLTPNASFVGYIHASQADFILTGGGVNTFDFIGSSMTRSLVVSGNFSFHFDESLRLNGPPFITMQPHDIARLTGQSAGFTISAIGESPMESGLQFYGTNISQSVLTNLTADQAGPYSVTLSNVLGSVTSNPAILSIYASAEAVLTVPTFTPNNQLQLQVTGVPSFLYSVLGSTNLTDWTSLRTNFSPFVFTDPESTNFSQRFYRSQYLP